MFDFEAAEKRLNLKLENLEMKITYLYYIEKYSIRQIAKVLECGNHTVSRTLHNFSGVRDRKRALALRSTDEYREKISQTKIGEKNIQAKLTESDVLDIRESYPKLLGTFNKTQAQYLLADEYGVKRPTISDIVLRRTWKHI